MIEMKYILENMNTDSLILIDELCRSTNFNEGLALSISICEYMLAKINENLYEHGKRIFVFYASHYTEISSLEYLYPKIKGFNLVSFLDESQKMMHTRKLSEGYCRQNDYGEFGGDFH
jgi:DNA mismatch repair ATPase MutS